MASTGQTISRPRSALVITGGLVAIIGLLSGVLVTTPQLHVAMMLNDEPVEMTWYELANEGIGGNAHVRLTGVSLERKEAPSFLNEMLKLESGEPRGSDPESIPVSSPQPEIQIVGDVVVGPWKVYPQDQSPELVPDLVVIPDSGDAAERATLEITTSGTLTGRFIPLATADSTVDTVRLVSGDRTAVGPTSTTDVAEGGVLDRSPPVAELPRLPLAVRTTFVYQSPDETLGQQEAEQWFCLSGLAVAFGLVICGAGGPSRKCWLFFQGPAILSLLGYPMRYGRATKKTRLAYAVLGGGLVVYGCKAMVFDARLGRVEGDVVDASLAFIPLFFGAAAMFGACANLIVERFGFSLDFPSKPNDDEPRISLSDACSVEPDESEEGVDLQDRGLQPPSCPVPQKLLSLAETLSEVGFEGASHFEFDEGLERVAVMLQLGCQEMVVADVEQYETGQYSRLVSVLHDGFAMITLSSNCESEKLCRYGTHGQYSRAASTNPLDMLSTHLEQTLAMAEKRGTAVVNLDTSEVVDVAEYGRFVLVDVRCQYGEANRRVRSASFGRFHFPPEPVASLEEASQIV